MMKREWVYFAEGSQKRWYLSPHNRIDGSAFIQKWQGEWIITNTEYAQDPPVTYSGPFPNFKVAKAAWYVLFGREP